MSVAPHSGIIDFGTFESPTGGLDGKQGEVPAPLIAEAGYFLSTNGWAPGGGGGGAVTQIIAGTNISISPAGGTGAVTISSTGSGGGVSSVTGTAPVVSSGGTTPAISMAKATTSVDGYLSSTDWTTFNNKQAAGAYLTAITADTPLSGSGTSGSHLVIAQATTSVSGYLTSTDWNTFNNKQTAGAYLTAVTADSPLSGSGTSGSHLVISAATTSVSGYLTSTDWNTFNNKQPAGSYLTTVTADSPLTGSGTSGSHLAIPAATSLASGYLTNTDWSTFNSKQAALVSGTSIKTVGGTTLLGAGDVPVVTSIVAGTNVTISPVGGTGAVTINATGGGGSTSPGGSNTQVQYNNSGAFGGSSSFTWDGTTLKASNLETTGGVLADGAFGGTFVDGIVLDYDTVGGAGRISVGGADKINFYNSGVAGSLLGSAASNGDWSFARFVDIGNGTLIGGATNPVLASAASANNYVQAYIHNDNAGTSASADFVAYPDNGTDAHGWADMGVTSSTYADTTYTVTGPNESYLFGSAPSGSSTTGNLVYATDSTGTTNSHQWYVGGFTQAKSAWKMQLTSSGLSLANALSVGNGGTGATTAGAALTNLGAQATLVSGTSIKTVNSTSLLGSGDVAVQPTLVSATNIKTINGASILGSGDLTVTGSFTGGTLTSNLTLAANSTSLQPLKFQSGSLNTTAAAGVVEYDGNAFYASSAASTRGVMPTEQWVVLTGTNTLTSQTAVQPIFDGGGGPTNGSVTLPVGTYQFECVYALTAMSATSGSFGFALGGAATFTYSYDATASKAGTAAATSQAGFKLFSSAASTALVTNSTGTVGSALIKGIIRVTVAGTIIPQVSLTVAAAAIVSTNSYFKVSPLGNVSTVATVGNWA